MARSCRGAGSTDQNPLAEICAYPGGILTDGFGLGGYGQGGFGRAASSYAWTSPALKSGTWSFAVVSVDAAGNLGVPAATSIDHPGPPAPAGRLCRRIAAQVHIQSGDPLRDAHLAGQPG